MPSENSSRTYVVTGAASGIGAGTARVLRELGHEVIGVDLQGCDVNVDLSTPDGRAALVDQVGARTDSLDAVIANAGVLQPSEPAVRVNFFGAVSTLVGLRPLLAGSPAPRAAATVSIALLNDVSDALVEACLDGDEERAVALVNDPARADEFVDAYTSSKRALARWIRRQAPRDEWAGAGIALNAIAPGVIRTPMIQDTLDDPEGFEMVRAGMPMPLGGVAEPEAVGRAFAFLTDSTTLAITGQILFVDAGAESVLRGDDIWP
jgi:NAD(P)-dependent dehydrogenase (short-subunit alcohol dehydrogenase family)